MCLLDAGGGYENLQGDFDEAHRRRGMASRPLPHRRQAKGRKDFRHYYDDDTAERVAAYFKTDIDNLGYRFDPE